MIRTQRRRLSYSIFDYGSLSLDWIGLDWIGCAAVIKLDNKKTAFQRELLLLCSGWAASFFFCCWFFFACFLAQFLVLVYSSE